MILNRELPEEDGVFGRIQSAQGEVDLDTLEHAYLSDSGTYTAKIPAGIYQCERYLSLKRGYEVFRLLDVPGSTYDEIHIGNFNHDSDGCILLGIGIQTLSSHERMLVHSQNAFEHFMAYQDGVQRFSLTIKDA